MRLFPERVPISVCDSFTFGFWDRTWDSDVLIPDHCLSFYSAHSWRLYYSFILFFLVGFSTLLVCEVVSGLID